MVRSQWQVIRSCSGSSSQAVYTGPRIISRRNGLSKYHMTKRHGCALMNKTIRRTSLACSCPVLSSGSRRTKCAIYPHESDRTRHQRRMRPERRWFRAFRPLWSINSLCTSKRSPHQTLARILYLRTSSAYLVYFRDTLSHINYSYQKSPDMALYQIIKCRFHERLWKWENA